MVGDLQLWELQAIKDVVIPQGVEKIGEKWFANSDIESVTIPTSVHEIQAGAFYCCRHLAKVIFKQSGSQLRVIGREAF